MANDYKIIEDTTKAGLEAKVNVELQDNTVAPAGGVSVLQQMDGVVWFRQVVYKP